MKLALYPGCSLESTAKEYLDSTIVVAKALGIELEEIPDWICCGSTPAHMAEGALTLFHLAHKGQCVVAAFA